MAAVSQGCVLVCFCLNCQLWRFGGHCPRSTIARNGRRKKDRTREKRATTRTKNSQKTSHVFLRLRCSCASGRDGSVGVWLPRFLGVTAVWYRAVSHVQSCPSFPWRETASSSPEGNLTPPFRIGPRKAKKCSDCDSRKGWPLRLIGAQEGGQLGLGLLSEAV